MKNFLPDEEEIEIKDFIEKYLKDNSNKQRYLESFLSDKIDPKSKFVIKTFNGNYINEDKSNNISQISNKLQGKHYKKVKLQIRLEDTTDVDDLISFLQIIRLSLDEEDEEIKINQNRSDILGEILDDTPKVKIHW